MAKKRAKQTKKGTSGKKVEAKHCMPDDGIYNISPDYPSFLGN